MNCKKLKNAIYSTEKRGVKKSLDKKNKNRIYMLKLMDYKDIKCPVRK